MPIRSAKLSLALTGASFLLLAGLATPRAADSPGKTSSVPYTKALQPFLAKYCVSCHGPDKQNGSLTLHDKKPESLQDDRLTWQNVVERLKKNEMPPAKKPQPAADEKRNAIAWIESEMAKATCDKPGDPGRVTLRRLNRAEYNNTIRDLLALNFQPAEDFPADDVGYGFDNIGDVLAVSPLLLEKYMAAAESIALKAFTGSLPPLPPKKTIPEQRLKPADKSRIDSNARSVLFEGEMTFAFPFPSAGEYILLYHALGEQIDKEPARIRLTVDGKEFHAENLRPYAPDRAAPDREIKFKVAAGSHTIGMGIVNPKADPEPKPGKPRDRAIHFGHSEIRGPIVPLDPIMPEAYRRIMIAKPDAKTSKAEAAKRIVENLARRAFRRPPTADEVTRLVKLVELAEKNGDSFERGVQLAVQAILVSPHFLFMVERDRKLVDKPYAIFDHELATRLSYFLWSSCPDEELSRIADRGALRKELEPQVRRMLKDPKVRALGENFAGQWLQIRNLKSFAPDAKTFPSFDEPLRDAMMRETTLFFEAMVREDRSLLDFLDADFTFVNERLAKHYGIRGIRGPEFRRVSLSGTERAGILSHASVLTVTSNVTRTSPVKRGKFIMESLLNANVPPPPQDVPELNESKEAITSGSLRQRMEKHRTNPDCAVCHQKMDPLGFAFENFDGIGAWRTRDGEFAIDPSGTLPDGRSFAGPAELRKLLRSDPAQFRLCLADRLLTYALGRGVESGDRCAVDKICQQTRDKQDRISELVLAIVTSDPFQMRTPSTLGTRK